MSVIFLVFQIIFIIDFAYEWNDSWVQKYEDSGEDRYWSVCLSLFSVLMWGISLTVTVFNYYWFSESSLHVILISTTFGLGVVFTVLSISNWVENGSLLVSSMVNLYITYLCWDGLSSSPDNPIGDDLSTGMSIMWGTLITFTILMYLSFAQKNDKQEEGIRKAAEPMLAEESENKEAYAEEMDDKKMVYFLLFMVLAAVYLSMLLTNWGSPNVNGKTSQQ